MIDRQSHSDGDVIERTIDRDRDSVAMYEIYPCDGGEKVALHVYDLVNDNALVFLSREQVDQLIADLVKVRP